jgi:hypothetical protein
MRGRTARETALSVVWRRGIKNKMRMCFWWTSWPRSPKMCVNLQRKTQTFENTCIFICSGFQCFLEVHLIPVRISDSQMERLFKETNEKYITRTYRTAGNRVVTNAEQTASSGQISDVRQDILLERTESCLFCSASLYSGQLYGSV